MYRLKNEHLQTVNQNNDLKQKMEELNVKLASSVNSMSKSKPKTGEVVREGDGLQNKLVGRVTALKEDKK